MLAYSGISLAGSEYTGQGSSIAAAITGHEEGEGGGWCLFEDLGPLSHDFRLSTAEALIPRIAEWHALPVDRLLNAPLLGPKPTIDVLLRDVLSREADLRDALSAVPAGEESLERILAPLKAGGAFDPRESGWSARVLSHGDLHLGNYALANGQLKVLDWEHVHLNSPYWDLYHLLDLSHPVFPKAMEAADRERLLERYASESARRDGTALPADYKRAYARFAAVFSLWMLLLIEKDLAALAASADLPVPWSPEQLRRQRTETLDSFTQCAAMLGDR